MSGHAARLHARYGSSNAHRVLGCPGSVRMAALCPKPPESEAAVRGTTAHEYLQRLLMPSSATLWTQIPVEHRDGLRLVLDFLEELTLQEGSGIVAPEVGFTFPQSVVATNDAAGILDVVVGIGLRWWIIDYKTGAVPVEATSPQLDFSAVGFLWNMPVSEVTLVIIQPNVPWHRDGPIRSRTVNVFDLIEFQAKMEAAIFAAEQPDAPLRPGEHCRFCPAEAHCPAREKHALAGPGLPSARVIAAEALPPPPSLGMDRIAHILQHADDLRSWLRAIETYAQGQAMQGVDVPGHKLVETAGRRAWNVTYDEALAALTPLIEIDIDTLAPRTLIGITEAEKLVVRAARDAAPRGKKDDAVKTAKDAMAHLTLKQSSGNLTLAPISDPRPPVNRLEAAFKGVAIPAPPKEIP